MHLKEVAVVVPYYFFLPLFLKLPPIEGLGGLPTSIWFFLLDFVVCEKLNFHNLLRRVVSKKPVGFRAYVSE